MSDEQQKRIFVKNLNKYIEESGKRQIEIAEALSISPQLLNTWTQGKAIPRMGKIQRLADYFGIHKSDLLEDHDSSPSATEQRLLAVFRKLDAADQDEVVRFADFKAAAPKYAEERKERLA